MSWPNTQMPSEGEDHDTLCRGPGAPEKCSPMCEWMNEALYYELVVNVPYNPLKDHYDIDFFGVNWRERKLTRYGRAFWLCPRTDAEKAAYDKAVAAERAARNPRPNWWERFLIWLIEKAFGPAHSS